MITPIYLIGYFPIKVSMITIAKINAAVDKFAGRISISVIKTGSHKSIIDDLKSISIFMWC